jgi:hypothetical protein
VHNQEKGALKFGALNSNVQNKKIGAQKFGAQKNVAQNLSNLAHNMDARKSSVQHKKICTDPLKTDAKKDTDPLGNLVEKERLHKAKRTLEDFQKLNIKQWTSLKNNVEKETKTWKKCLVKRNQEPQHLGPSFQCDQHGLPRLTPGIKQPVWVHNRRKFLQSLTFKERNI